MAEGFLGYQTTFMLDVVVCALLLVVPALIYSIYQVKQKRNYPRHKFLQLMLAGVLLFAVAAFEVDIQMVHGGWEHVVNKNPDAPRRSAEEMTPHPPDAHGASVFRGDDADFMGGHHRAGSQAVPQAPGSGSSQPVAQNPGLDFHDRSDFDLGHRSAVLLSRLRRRVTAYDALCVSLCAAVWPFAPV